MTGTNHGTDDRRAHISGPGHFRMFPPEQGEPELLTIPTENGIEILYLPNGADYPDELMRVRW